MTDDFKPEWEVGDPVPEFSINVSTRTVVDQIQPLAQYKFKVRFIGREDYDFITDNVEAVHVSFSDKMMTLKIREDVTGKVMSLMKRMAGDYNWVKEIVIEHLPDLYTGFKVTYTVEIVRSHDFDVDYTSSAPILHVLKLSFTEVAMDYIDSSDIA